MTDTDDVIVLSDSNLALVEELRSLRETSKKLKAREAEIRAALLDELQNAESGVTAAGTRMVIVDRQSREKVDTKRLQALYEDAWKDCLIETSVAVIRLPDVLDD